MSLYFSQIEKLTTYHETSAFSCGEEQLDQFLKKYAFINQKSNSSQTYVVCRAKQVVGFYSLAVGSVLPERSPSRVIKGLAKHPVPVMILTRLAVDKGEQGRGLGKALLKNALLRTAEAAQIAGIRALFVHAKNEHAKSWYLQFDFEPSPVDNLHLFLLTKDIVALFLAEKN